MYRKKPYPHNSDIADAILESLSRYPLLTPQEFPSKVIEILQEKGFYTRLVSVKRIWRIYEKMVRRREIYDALDVVKNSPHRRPRF